MPCRLRGRKHIIIINLRIVGYDTYILDVMTFPRTHGAAPYGWKRIIIINLRIVGYDTYIYLTP